MRTSALLLLVSLSALAQDPPGRFDRFCDRADTGRSDRGLPCGGLLFEAFATGGAGTNGVCSTTPPTGSRGEVLTFARASSATCVKTATGGYSTSGIADGDLVVLGTNVPRVEYDNSGNLGLLREYVATVNLLLRFILLTDAAWADVNTPILTGGQTSPWTGTYATSAVQVNDDNAAAFEGRTQNVTVSAGVAHTMHCYVKAGTLNKATISLDGTTASITGLSTSTWSIVQVTDASSSGVSIAAQVLNGSVVGDTGTVIFGGCQVETGSRITRMVPTDGATATRVSDGEPSFAVTYSAAPACGVLTVTTNYTPTVETWFSVPNGSGNPDMLGRFSGGNAGCYERALGTDLAAGTWTSGTNRWLCDTSRQSYLNAASATGAGAVFAGGGTSLGIGNSAFATPVSGIFSRVAFDNSTSRCSP